MPSFKMYIMQDGADFYVYDSAECDNLVITRTYPGRVADFDMDAARKARQWFKGLMSANQQYHFVGGSIERKLRIITDKRTQNLNCESDWEQESVKVIDPENRSDKIWLRNHLTWAHNNNRRLTFDNIESN